MSQSNPFSEQYPHPQSHPAPTSTKRVLIIVAIIMAGIALFCAGIGTIAFVAMQRIARPAPEVELAPREDSFARDTADFNRSLDRLLDEKQSQSTPSIDPAIQQFIDDSSDKLENGDDVRFSLTLFIEAVAMSDHSGGSLSIMDRLALRTWLAEYQPNPDGISGELRVLDVRLDSTGKLAVVDLLAYSDSDQAESLQWFLVHEGGQWKFYDWQRLEFGRRLSDEYASYLHGESPLDEGYDNALTELSEAEIAWYEGEPDRAKQIIRAAEAKPMLPQDRPVLQLQAAYTWMRLEQYDEAVRVLKAVENPDSLWGVWPSLAVCYYNLEEHKLALQAANNAQKQSPNHPNGFWIASLIYDELDQNDKASDAAIKALRICPLDSVIFYNAITQGRPQDVPQLVDIIAENDEEYQWTQLLSQTFRESSEFPKAVVDELKQRDDLPAGLLEIALGNLAWSSDQFDEAAGHFLKSQSVAELEYIKTIATENHLDVRLQDDDFEKLFAESPPGDSLLRSLVLRAYDDSLYCDLEKLLAALQSHTSASENGWSNALTGWAHYTNVDYEQAVASFDDFLAWRGSVESEPGDELDETEGLDDDTWLDAVTADYLVDSLLELGRPLEIIERWPEDAGKHYQVGSFLQLQANATQLDRFIESTAATTSDSVRIQRLRLQADQAMSEKETEQAATYHREAIELASSVYEEDESYFIDELIRRFARDLVLGNYVATDDEISDLDFDDNVDLNVLVNAAVRESIRVCDDDEFAAWIRRAEQLPHDTDENYAALQFAAGDYYASKNQLLDAIEAYKQNVRTSSADSWSLPRGIEAVVGVMVRAGQVDEARQWVSANPIPDSEVADEAIVDIATGNFTSLLDHLAAVDKAKATDWLQRQSLTDGLSSHADSPEFAKLIGQFPIRIPYITVDSAGELLSKASEPIDQQRVAEVLEAALGESFTAKAVVDEESNPSQIAEQAWLFQSVAGQRILVSSSERQYRTDNLSDWLGERLSTPVTRIKFSIMDDKPNSTQRLFAVASEQAGDDTLAFTWSGGNEIWSGPQLAAQLTWSDRVPVQLATQTRPLVEVPLEDADTEYEYVGINEWDQHLQDAGENLDAVLAINANGVRETISCTISKVDAEEYDIYVSPARDSVLLPFVKAGFTYTCGPSNLSLPKTKSN
ncbi:tetratricopeptide repeat protein [Novipirellula sp. SH528]|uniref:tetratricopeptide repeat protein n=1 Tax=Novipirellula sp. SH528 TaxID=3454466 RepID=UPI003FA051D5